MKIKTIVFLMLLSLMAMATLHAQNVTITDDSTHNAHGSSMLDVHSASKGFLMPRLTTTQRTGIAYPATGLIVFDTDSSNFFFYNGSAWVNLLTLANIAAISDTIWKEDVANKYVRLNNSINRVGVGVNNPDGKMEVWGDSIHNATDTIPLFAVKDKDGNDVFVVYPRGVMVYVDTITDTSGYKDNVTTSVTGFRVGKKTGAGSKGFDDEYFTISPAGNVDTLGSQARILWYPLKEAFLSGRVIVESPDSVGYNSWASGYLSKSIGDYSQALGYRPKAVGNYSTAIGNYALALGDNSFALGDSTIAGGGGGNKALNNFCYAFGKSSHALGNGSYAFGYKAKSTGQDAYAFGTGTEASGMGSFAIGFIGRDSANISTGNTKATADWAVAIGMGAQASEKGAFSIGTNSLAQNDYALAMGYKTIANGMYSSAFGYKSTAGGTGSTSMGYNTAAGGVSSIAMGYGSIANGDYATAMGNNSSASGMYSTAMGLGNVASGEVSTAMGSATIASNSSSTAMGNGTRASGFVSTAIGYQSVASGSQSTAIGVYATASEYATTALGEGTTASGIMSTAMGIESTASGRYSTTIGYYTTSQACGSFVVGRYNLISGSMVSWVDSDPLFVIGNGTSTSARSNAITVLKNGKVGIGTEDPSVLLHIGGSDNDTVRIGKNSGIHKLEFYRGSGNYGFRISVGSSGQVSFDMSSDGWSTITKTHLVFGASGSNNVRPGADNTLSLGTSSYRWTTVYATNGTINTSDIREKTNIEPLYYGLSEIMKLKPILFNWKSNPYDTKKVGFIAQDVQQIIPNVISIGCPEIKSIENGKEIVTQEKSDILGIYYSDMIPVLVKAIQEQQQQINELKAEIMALNNKQNKPAQISGENSEIQKLSLQIEELNKKYDALMAKQGVSSNK